MTRRIFGGFVPGELAWGVQGGYVRAVYDLEPNQNSTIRLQVVRELGTPDFMLGDNLRYFFIQNFQPQTSINTLRNTLSSPDLLAFL